MLVTSHKLKHALELIEPAIPKGKLSMPITANFLLQGGRVSATNLEIAISAAVPEATGRAAICLPHALVKRFLQHVSDTEMLDITVKGYKTTIKAGRMTSVVQGSNPKDFPALTEIAEEGEQSVDGDRLVRSLMSAAPAASTESARPVLQGVCLTFGEPIKVAAGDGFQLMWQDAIGLNMAEPGENQPYVIIPKTTIDAIDTLWRKAIKVPARNGSPFSELQHQPTLDAAAFAIAKRMLKVRFNMADNKMSLNVGEATLTTQLIAGEFPNFRSMIQEDQPHQVTFDAAEAFRVVRMLSGIAKEGSNILRMKWAEDYIEFSAKGESAGEMSQSMPATVRGDPSNIAFNVRYLLEYFSGKEGLILLETSTVSTPARFTHGRSPNLQLMPMFVQWGESEETLGEALGQTPGEEPGEEFTAESPDPEGVQQAIDGSSEEGGSDGVVDETTEAPATRRRRSRTAE